MRIFHTAAGAAALLMIASTASAQPVFGNLPGYFYGNLGYTYFSLDEGGDDLSLNAITGRLGYMFNTFVGAEGEASFGIGDEDINLGPGSTGTVHISDDWAIFLVGKFPLGTTNFNVFGRIGYGWLNTTVKFAGISEDGHDNQWRVGLGAEGFFDGLNGIRAEYTNLGWLDDDDDIDADVFSLSYVRRF